MPWDQEWVWRSHFFKRFLLQNKLKFGLRVSLSLTWFLLRQKSNSWFYGLTFFYLVSLKKKTIVWFDDFNFFNFTSRSLGQVDVKKVPQHLLLNLNKFTRQQKIIIQTTPKFLQMLSRGASLATKECRQQFQFRKWNCPTYNTATVFGMILKKGQF